jgi:ferredoxin
MAMKTLIAVNPIACDGHGLCAELLPELITLDDWGYPTVHAKEIPENLEVHARRARDLCPTLAILLEKVAD